MAKLGRPNNAPSRRREVLAVAADMFSRRGFRATSMNEIAQATGLSKPTLYHYFHNKEELLVQLYEDVMDGSVTQARQIAAQTLDPVELLRALIIRRVISTCEDQAMFKVFFEEEEELPREMLERVIAGRRTFESIFKEAIQRAVEMNSPALPVEPTLFANTCLGAANWVYKWYDPNGRKSAEQIGREIADYLLTALRP